MAKIFHWQSLSESVAIFRLKNVGSREFPDYKAGQNIDLYRDGTAKTFSIASSPRETKEHGYLEFFISRENLLSEGDQVEYAGSASGHFTLDRTAGFRSVVFVATGTGIAPFISMIRELNYSGANGIQYTLISGSRKLSELGYHKELSALAAAGKLDLLYVPTISRPSSSDWNLTSIGKGRAGNLLRRMLHLPCKGEAVLPAAVMEQELNRRFQSGSTIIMACGSHASVADIKSVAVEKHIPFEKEDW